MVDTNTLINIALTIIANFTNVVHVPENAVPKDSGDIVHQVVGGPRDPTDLYLVDKKGTEFWIRNGVVFAYRSPGSYFEQDQSRMALN